MHRRQPPRVACIRSNCGGSRRGTVGVTSQAHHEIDAHDGRPAKLTHGLTSISTKLGVTPTAVSLHSPDDLSIPTTETLPAASSNARA